MRRTNLLFIAIFFMIVVNQKSQNSPDTWEVQITEERSVEPAIALNPTNNNILTAYMEYSISEPRILYSLLSPEGEILSEGIITDHGSDPDVLFDSYGNAFILFLDQTAQADIAICRSLNGGVNFEDKIIIKAGEFCNDKPFFVIDNNQSSEWFNRIYVAYTSYCEEFRVNIECSYSTNINPGVGELEFSEPIEIIDVCKSSSW